MLPEDFPARVAERARDLYSKDRLNCAEAAFKALIEESGTPCPPELLRVASAFGQGMGGAGCVCGALAGSQMAIGCFFGRTMAHGPVPGRCRRLAKEMHDRFVQANRITCCRLLHRGLVHGTKEQRQACTNLTMQTARTAAELILQAQKDAALQQEAGQGA